MKSLTSIGIENATIRPVWVNGAGGVTYAVFPNTPDISPQYFVKWNPKSSSESLEDEAERLRWLERKHPVPQICDLTVSENQEVLITRALPGESAVSDRWKQDPDRALHALGTGLRLLHEIPIADCPYEWSINHRMRLGNISSNLLGEIPEVDVYVLCHGDPCAPNTLISDDGSFLAHVDVARIGIAARWADLAVITMSFEWNYEFFDESVFWKAYGVQPDTKRIEFYRTLWNAE